MLKSTARFATFALAGTLLVGGGVLCTHAENAYDSAAVAGITLSMNEYVSSIEDEAPAVEATDVSGEAEAKESGKNKKFVAANVENAVNVRKKGSIKSKVVGQMYRGDTGKLVEKGKKWSKIKSGNVVGYVRNDFLFFGDKARNYADKICSKTAIVNTTTLNVRTKKSTEADIVTQIPETGEYSVVKEFDNWVKISIDGDVKGYVSKEFVDIDVNYGKALTMKEIKEINDANAAAEAAEAAQATTTVTETVKSTESSSVSSVKPTRKSTVSSTNGSSFSNSSVSSASTSTSGLGSQIANYALQFVGNPYVYGGTSLTNGTDCSGFTMSVYAHFGYGLSRTAAAQSGNGRSVSFSSLQPGDLIFYNGGGGISHVALYVGGGMVVHASNRKEGIKTSPYNYRTPCKAVRIIQ